VPGPPWSLVLLSGDSTVRMAIRSARLDDAAALATLWDAAGLHFWAEYVEWELRSALAATRTW
jgi:hypothetical protein